LCQRFIIQQFKKSVKHFRVTAVFTSFCPWRAAAAAAAAADIYAAAAERIHTPPTTLRRESTKKNEKKILSVAKVAAGWRLTSGL
jgi:hypothetical protein